MGSLIAALVSSADAIHTYQRSLQVVENNVTNATTPGWARQVLPLVAERLRGDVGGVTVGDMLSARSEFLEQTVRNHQEDAGYAAQRNTDLSSLESIFTISGDGGLDSDVNNFFTSVSQWSVNPNHDPSRQAVLDRAANVANSFSSAARSLGDQSQKTDQEIRSSVDTINHLAQKLADLNQQKRRDFASNSDPGLDASIYNTLEELSTLTNYTALPQADGSVSVSIGGQLPLVVGDHVYTLSANFSSQQTTISSPEGDDLTGSINKGQLGALLATRNQEIPALTTNLDTFAQQFADQVNGVLNGGVDLNGSAPTQGLFSYDPEHPAMTMAITDMTPDQLAAATPDNPGGNENAMKLVDLGQATVMNGLTFNGFYASIAAGVGRDRADAKDASSLAQQLLTQAQTARSEGQSVSLDGEAAHLVELQRGYEAVEKLMSVLSDLTTVALGLIQS